MNTLFIKIAVNVVLGWLKSLWDRFVEKRRNIEQGRQEIIKAVEKKNDEIKAEAEKLRNTDSSWDDTSSWLRDRIQRGDSVRKD